MSARTVACPVAMIRCETKSALLFDPRAPRAARLDELVDEERREDGEHRGDPPAGEAGREEERRDHDHGGRGAQRAELHPRVERRAPVHRADGLEAGGRHGRGRCQRRAGGGARSPPRS